MKNTKNGKAVKSVKPAAKKAAAKKPAPKKSSAPKVKRNLFGFPISVVVHRLALLDWKPSAIIKAITATKGNSGCSPAALRSALYNAKHNAKELRAADRIANLSKQQIATLTKLAA